MVHQKLDISVYREANETIVALTGEIDLHTAPRLSSAVDAALADAPVRVVLDMRGVTFCDSRGLGTLVVLARAAARSRAVLVLSNLGDFLKRLLAVSGIGEHFVIREAPEDEDDAVPDADAADSSADDLSADDASSTEDLPDAASSNDDSPNADSPDEAGGPERPDQEPTR
ncbi:STAS domain-containing protein [Glycomyces sp. NRRL B-16210]|uniref:STAS domain-containing protein n=1 Tax=Glycomyces sp. NRRL B-16210 TaxID=1463821 RepID=UPI000AD1B013|nr:STAS domain-containing protein [Glycomyces sp. NRRL B-16210]